MTTEIRSVHNQQYKRWRRFVANPERDSCPWIPVEGRKQVSELVQTQILELLVFCSEWVSPSQTLVSQARRSVELPRKLFCGLSDVDSSQGVLGFFSKPAWTLSDLTPYVLYLNRLQDPGNLGTLLRTAAATGLFSVVTSPGTVSCFNNKVVRASAGYLFSVPFLQRLAIDTLEERKYRLLVTHPRDGKSLFVARLDPPVALILGSEGSGVDLSSVGNSVERIQIPMAHGQESLNVAVSGALLMYEVFRRNLL